MMVSHVKLDACNVGLILCGMIAGDVKITEKGKRSQPQPRPQLQHHDFFTHSLVPQIVVSTLKIESSQNN